jgi:hypothetical protein
MLRGAPEVPVVVFTQLYGYLHLLCRGVQSIGNEYDHDVMYGLGQHDGSANLAVTMRGLE